MFPMQPEKRTADLKNPRVKKGLLIESLRKNKDTHRATFEKALDDYKVAVVAELEERLEDARKGKRLNQTFFLQQPEDHTRDYERVIKQLEMDVDDEVDLSEQEFAAYVMDQWSWTQQFTQTSQMYNTMANAPRERKP